MEKITTNLKYGILLLAVGLWVIAGCRKEPIVSQTTEDVNMTGYFDKYPEEFSEFRKVIERSGTASFLGAYGAYTIFAPTNSAFDAFLKAENKSSVDDFSPEELKDLVRFHLIEDTIYTTKFTDGKLPKLTMYGQYLITGATNVNGTSHITINRQANLVKGNIVVGNGIIHSIDQVLQPAVKTVAALIEANENYHIFSRALKETGLYDKLNVLPQENTEADSAARWLTVVVEPDDVLAQAGFPTYEALKARYSQTGHPKDPTDSLYLFMAYHVFPEARYLADIVSRTSHPTWAPLEVVTSKLFNQEVLLNDDDFNGQHEPGVVLDPLASDVSATNGVLHQVEGHYGIKVRNPVPVYWDVCDQPEFARLPGYRNGALKFTVNLKAGDKYLEAIRWERDGITYNAAAGTGHFWGDQLIIPLSGSSNSRNHWVEFTTPLLVKGRYKVWICYRRVSPVVAQAYFDGVPLARTVNFSEWNLTTGTDEEREALGFKFHTNVNDSRYVGRLLGTIDVETTDRHILRFEGVSGSGDGNGTWWDMIHFIPVDMDQIYPKFLQDGTILQRPK